MSAPIDRPWFADPVTRLTALFALFLLVPSAAVAGDEPLPERTITSKVTDTKNQLTLRGNVSPGHAGGEVVVQRQKCGDDACDWRRWAVVIANDSGGFRSRIDAPREGSWYWRAKVAGYDGYATSYSQVWRTFND